MNEAILKSVKKPPIYTKTKVEFWNDEYISKQMLEAHLNPEFEAASRKLAFIDKSVAWIKKLVPPTTYPTLLDFGCGPGIYGERFAKAGYKVTGVDFSKRSINYAKQTAAEQGLDITYYYLNYLELDLKERYDVATMIYCDYGALSTEDRKIILKKAYDHLKPGGKLLFDVFSMVRYNQSNEYQSWELCENGGFWRGEPYVAINGHYKYPDHVTLNLTSIITDDEITPYYIWDTNFTKETLIQEVESSGFHVCGIYGDVAGSPYQDESETIAILLEK